MCDIRSFLEARNITYRPKESLLLFSLQQKYQYAHVAISSKIQARRSVMTP